MVIAPETGTEGVEILAERIRSAVEQKEIHYKEQIIQITVSIGFAVAQADQLSTYDQLKHIAAQALGEAKANGRNCCVIHDVAPH